MYSDDMADVHVTILAGGRGTRLWPQSRKRCPKQLLSLVGERSLLRRTVDRVLPLVPPEHIYILTGPDYQEPIARQVAEIPRENIFVEPSPKGTAPCLGWASMRLRKRHPGSSVMVSLHADHAVQREDAFRQALRVAVNTARKGYLVTVGIVPSRPETGYGYIERGEAICSQQGFSVYRVSRFTEKPDLETATRFVASGRYYWNSGYFAWTLDNILDEFQLLLPELYARLDAMGTSAAGDEERIRAIWEQIEPVSIDVGIMEHARQVAVVPAEMGWSDVGSWQAIYELFEPGPDGHVVLGQATHVSLGAQGLLIRSEEGKLVATVGVRDLVIIDCLDALLIVPRDRAQEVSQLVKQIGAQGLDRYL